MFNPMKMAVVTVLFTVPHTSACEIEDLEQQVTPAHIRCAILRSYFGTTIDNSDPSVFEHYEKWHAQDSAAIRRRVKNSTNRVSLRYIHATLRKSFSESSMTYAKLAMGYRLYAKVLDAEIENRIFDDKANSTKVALDYIKGVEHRPLREKEINKPDGLFILRYIIRVCKDMGIRCLPITSSATLSTYRDLNESFGLRTPIIELPLGRRSYDGALNALPSSVLDHDIEDHMAFMYLCFRSNESVLQRFEIYRKMNDIVRVIPEIIIRIKADYFLYLLGHERHFDNEGILNISAGDDHPPLTSESVDIQCERVFREQTENVGNLELGCRPPKDDDQKGSYLAQFIDPTTGCLYSLARLLEVFDLDKTKPISIDSLRRLRTLRLPPIHDQDRDAVESSLETIDRETLEYWFDGFSPQYGRLGVFAYNILLETQAYFQQNGIPFQLWNGPKVNKASLIEIYRDILETFKREVGAKFKGL